MYRISELAHKAGMSRTALLYYEKLGLIRGKRLSNGYRSYSDGDLQCIRLLQKLRAGGLTLQECKACMETKVDATMLAGRLAQLEKEIEQKQQARELLRAMLGQGDLKVWHQELDAVAPNAHQEWLMKQGFSEKDALHLRWLSKDMNQHDNYMADFMKVFQPLERWGPGSDTDTLKALAELPFAPQQVLDIGCGKGLASEVLALDTTAQIVALDNSQSALDQMSERLKALGLTERVTPVCASMTSLPFESEQFDLLWAEGCAYIMGVQEALQQWRRLLKDDGVLVLSDLVWTQEQPSEAALSFWQQDYPNMTTVATRIQQAEQAGYRVISHFPLSDPSWRNYHEPLSQRVRDLKPAMSDSQALADIERELDIYQNHLGEFGYEVFVLQK